TVLGRRTTHGRWPLMEAISLSGSDRRGFAARPSLLLPVWKGYRRGRSVHARNVGGDRLLYQGVHHHAVRAGYQPQPNRRRRFCSEIHAERLHAPGAAADTAGVGGLHFGNARRSGQSAARAPAEKHRVLYGERLSYLGFELRTEDPIACALQVL